MGVIWVYGGNLDPFARNLIPGESKKVYAFGGLWNKKYVTDIQK